MSGSTRKNIQTGEEKKKCEVSGKYDSTYLKFAFIQERDSELDSRPLCVICFERLSNNVLKPSKLERRLQSKHPKLAKKRLDYFERMREDIQKQAGALKK